MLFHTYLIKLTHQSYATMYKIGVSRHNAQYRIDKQEDYLAADMVVKPYVTTCMKKLYRDVIPFAYNEYVGDSAAYENEEYIIKKVVTMGATRAGNVYPDMKCFTGYSEVFLLDEILTPVLSLYMGRY